MADRWLVTGGTGQVGLALQRSPPPGVEILSPSRDRLDLTRPGDIAPLLDGVSAVINCAAYTAVDTAESEPDLAHAVNAVGPGLIARAAAAAGVPIVHVSTDYVFAADGKGPWAEDAAIAPASVYGRTKAAGEVAVRASGARHAIVRTAWVVSADGHNFVKTMLGIGASRDHLRVVADQRGTPTHAGDLAAALATIAARLASDPAQISGTWHFANAGDTTWHGLASHVFAVANRMGARVPAVVEAITTSEYPTPATRPADSRLDCRKIAADFAIRPRQWEGAVDEIVTHLLQQGTGL